MNSQYVHLSDISVAFGNYLVTLNYVGYDEPKKWHVKPHKHMNFELHMIGVGSGKLTVAGESFDMRFGSMYLTGPGVLHEQVSEYMEEYGMRFDVERRPSDEGNDDLIARSLLERPFFFVESVSDEWRARVAEIIREAHMQLPGYRQKIRGIFAWLITELGRIAADVSGSDSDPPGVQTIGSIDIKARLDTYFFGGDFATPAESVLKALHITRRHFSRLMQKYYGMTYTEKMNEQRIIYAKELLNAGTPYSEVWQKVGFNSAQYFARVFQKQVGMTPSEFRKKNSGQ